MYWEKGSNLVTTNISLIWPTEYESITKINWNAYVSILCQSSWQIYKASYRWVSIKHFNTVEYFHFNCLFIPRPKCYLKRTSDNLLNEEICIPKGSCERIHQRITEIQLSLGFWQAFDISKTLDYASSCYNSSDTVVYTNVIKNFITMRNCSTVFFTEGLFRRLPMLPLQSHPHMIPKETCDHNPDLMI